MATHLPATEGYSLPHAKVGGKERGHGVRKRTATMLQRAGCAEFIVVHTPTKTAAQWLPGKWLAGQVGLIATPGDRGEDGMAFGTPLKVPYCFGLHLRTWACALDSVLLRRLQVRGSACKCITVAGRQESSQQQLPLLPSSCTTSIAHHC